MHAQALGGEGAHNGCAVLAHRSKCVYCMRTHPDIKLHYSPFIVTSPTYWLVLAHKIPCMIVCSDVRISAYQRVLHERTDTLIHTLIRADTRISV